MQMRRGSPAPLMSFQLNIVCTQGIMAVDQGSDKQLLVRVLVFTGTYRNTIVGVDMKRAVYKNSQLLYGDATVPEGEILVTIVEHQQARPTARLTLDRSDGRRASIPLEDPQLGLSPTTKETVDQLLVTSAYPRSV